MNDMLQGIRIVEVARLLNGDALGMLLADLGADVVKVEFPPNGDYLRDINGCLAPGWGLMHLQVNRSKRSIRIDLRSEEGRATMDQLVAGADVFIDGNRGDWCDENGLGYRELSKANPGLVYVQYSGFGRKGPYGTLPTHGNSMNALAGDMPVVRGEDGLFRFRDQDGFLPAVKAGEGTQLGAMYGALAVTAALVGRQQSGQGCSIDVSGSDAVAAAGWLRAVYNVQADRLQEVEGIPVGPGRGAESDAKYQFYETADGKVLLFCAIEAKFWDGFCAAAGRPDLLERHDRSRGVDFANGDVELMHEIQAIIETKPLTEWMDLAVQHGLPLTPTPQTYQDVRDDPHVRARGVFVHHEHEVAGSMWLMATPAIVDGEPLGIRFGAPAMGQHTDEILQELS